MLHIPNAGVRAWCHLPCSWKRPGHSQGSTWCAWARGQEDTPKLWPFPQRRRSCCNAYKGDWKERWHLVSIGPACWFWLLGKGLLWLSCLFFFFLPGTGAVKRERRGGWRYLRSLLRKHRIASQLYSLIPSGLDKRGILFKSCCWLRSNKVAICSPFRPLLGRTLRTSD